MALARILAALLLCCSLSFAQKPTAASEAPTSSSAASSAEPWQILTPTTDASKTPLDGNQTDQGVIDPNNKSFRVAVPSDPMALNLYAQFGDDSVCYAIRSYVVARDSKDSDSVHPVSSSTCVPSRLYRYKKVKAQKESPAIAPQE